MSDTLGDMLTRIRNGQTTNKKVVDGKWYVELSQVAEIIGGDHGRK